MAGDPRRQPVRASATRHVRRALRHLGGRGTARALARYARTGAPDWMGDEDAMMWISAAVTVVVTFGILFYHLVDSGTPFDLWAAAGMVIFAPVVFLLAWIPTAIVLFVLALVAVIVLETSHGVRRAGRQERMWEDHQAYRAWRSRSKQMSTPRALRGANPGSSLAGRPCQCEADVGRPPRRGASHAVMAKSRLG